MDDDAYLVDDEQVPHPFGMGVCGELHFRDELTDTPCVLVPLEVDGKTAQVPKALVAGEGIARGDQPCEFHDGTGTFRVDPMLGEDEGEAGD